MHKAQSRAAWEGWGPERFHSASIQAALPSFSLTGPGNQSESSVISFAGADSFSHGRGLEVEEETRLENPVPSR